MIKIEVWSDINCPYCYIGKRHLELAKEKYKNADELVIEWKSFELDPVSRPEKGSDQLELLAQKYGRDRKWALEMNEKISNMALATGIHFNMDKVVPANSFHAHRLLHLAKEKGVQNELKERLLNAKFVQGKDIGSQDDLLEIASGLLSEADTKSVLESDRFATDVRQDEAEAAHLGINGVPFFVINRQFALSGAQPVEAFQEVFEKL
jgi:predicted DsbA family dithiol-disulfide isomerase